MCGPSDQQKQLASQQMTLSSQLASNYSQQFGQQSEVLNNLQNILTPIAEAGPDQQGFGSNELAALNTQSTEGVAGNYAKASQALNNNLAARGGGSEVLPSGASAALKGSLAASAANQESNQQLAITNANYNTGRQNWQAATGGLQTLANQYNPTGFASQATGANSSAFNQQMEDSQETSQEFGEIAGGISGLAQTGLSMATGIKGLSGPKPA